MSRTEILSRFGIVDRPDLRVSIIEEADALSLVDIHGVGDPVRALTPKRAMELSVELRRIGEEKLGQQISMAADKANRSNLTR